MDNKPSVVAVGAGRMGRGLAHVFAYAGHEVRLVDIKERDDESYTELANSAMYDIRSTVSLMAQLGQIKNDDVDTILDRVSIYSLGQVKDAFTDVDFIFEAVPEVLKIKQDAFSIICEHTAEVLGGELGLTSEAIADLRHRGVIAEGQV